jgi:hypothetical protein
MSEEQIPDFENFWPYYLNEHARATTRWFHFVGTNLSIALLIYAGVTMQLSLLPLAIVVGYAMAWISHFFIEKNRPATFKYPGWSFKADIKLVKLMWMGKLGAELDQHLVSSTGDGQLTANS